MSVAPADRRHEILVFTDDLGGGTGNHMLQVMDRLPSEWANVEVVSAAPHTARTLPSVEVTFLPEEPLQTYPLMQLWRLRRLAGIVRDRSPEVVHAYFFWSILFARLLKSVGLIPRLVENREDEGFAWGRHEYVWLRLTRSIPDRVICVSEAVREAAVGREGLDREITEVIHNGVRMPETVPEEEVTSLREELGIPSDAAVVGMVANLNRTVKGVERFVRMVPTLVEKVPEVRCLIVGGGPEEETFRREARRRGIADRLLLPGYREDIERFYALMDVSVLTSKSEGLSLTLLESMSHGVPVVATRVGGNPEVIEEGRTGYLVQEGETADFVARVVGLLRDCDLRRELGDAGRKRVESEFSLDKTANEYANLYRQSLDPQT